MVQGTLRKAIRKIHLYIGLWCGAIFILLGLTGSAIAWMPELDALLNPDLLQSSGENSIGSPSHPSTKLQPIIDKLSNDPAYGRPTRISMPVGRNDVFIAWYAPIKSGQTFSFEQKVSRQVMIDPFTLEIKGERNWGEAGLTRALLMPTLFHLHHYFLAGDAGKLFLALCGVLLLLLTVLGIALWAPRGNWRSIKQALSITHDGSRARFNYSSHRALGFYAAPVFLVLAVSGIYLNFPSWIVPVVSKLMTVSPRDKLENESAGREAPLTATDAVEIARMFYPDADITRVSLPATGSMPFEVRVWQKGEIQDGGATRVTIDSNDGKVLRIADPVQAPTGDIFLSWLFPLHSGQAFGVPGKVFISLFGLMPLLFAITGTCIWMKRRSKKPDRA